MDRPEGFEGVSLTEDEILAGIYDTDVSHQDRVESWQHRLLLLTVIGDAAAMAVAASLTFVSGAIADGTTPSPRDLVLLMGVAPLVWVLVIGLARGYDRRILGTSTDEYRRVIVAACWFGTVPAAFAFYAGLPLSPAFAASAAIGGASAALLVRNSTRTWLHRERLQGRYTKRVVVVGRPNTAAALVRHFAKSPTSDMEVVGLCLPPHEGHDAPDVLPDIPVLGQPEDVWVQALVVGADAIAIADTDALSASQVKALAWHLEGRGIEVMVVPAVTDVAGPRIQFRLAAGLPLIYLDEPRFGVVATVLKATFDRVLAIVALLVMAPLMALIAIAIKLTDRGPVFFKQTRVGFDSRPFIMWKFRSMVPDAEDRLDEVRHLNEHDGLLFKMRDDPRATRVGRFLRRWSLDELPQLWNVVRGDMSMVGPRPPLPSEVARYDAKIRRRLRVKPGLTGLWQVSGRSELSWDEGVRLDLEYIEQWSLLLDLVVLLRTARAVVRRAGAH
jgi:exopolysaccharide biosynthesis polyprenyl glycosylphosphotransferase